MNAMTATQPPQSTQEKMQEKMQAKTQAAIIDALGVAPTIDPGAEVERRVQFLADYLDATGAKGYVLGISGGQDSTLSLIHI